MCRYGDTTYKEHYACFHCRKAFKQPSYFDLPKDVRPKRREERVVVCPQCGSRMRNMGLDFKAPRQRSVDQWRKVELLYQRGITFHSCGCCGPGYRPATLAEVRAFVEGRLPDSEGERLLLRLAQSRRAS
jgi:DNA-directed RNA polymerase subunit RPC12/RpoP